MFRQLSPKILELAWKVVKQNFCIHNITFNITINDIWVRLFGLQCHSTQSAMLQLFAIYQYLIILYMCYDPQPFTEETLKYENSSFDHVKLVSPV